MGSERMRAHYAMPHPQDILNVTHELFSNAQTSPILKAVGIFGVLESDTRRELDAEVTRLFASTGHLNVHLYSQKIPAALARRILAGQIPDVSHREALEFVVRNMARDTGKMISRPIHVRELCYLFETLSEIPAVMNAAKNIIEKGSYKGKDHTVVHEHMVPLLDDHALHNAFGTGLVTQLLLRRYRGELHDCKSSKTQELLGWWTTGVAALATNVGGSNV